MNFTPFGTTFSGALPPTGGAVAQFTTAKFAHQVGAGAGAGQVVGLLSSDEAGVTYLRPVDANGFTLNIAGQGGGNNSEAAPQIITLPIQVPGAKPGDLPQQQTLQIQVVNPGGGSGGGSDKYHAVPISLQPFTQGGATVLTVSYANPHQDNGETIQLQLQQQDGDQGQQSHNNNNNGSGTNSGEASSQTMQEEMRVIDTSDWDAQGLADVKPIVGVQSEGVQADGGDAGTQTYPVPVAIVTTNALGERELPMILREDTKQEGDKDKADDKGESAEPGEMVNAGTLTQNQWQNLTVPGTTVADYLRGLPASTLPLSLHHFLKFSAETIKRESAIESSPLNQDEAGNPDDESQLTLNESAEMFGVQDVKPGKKKKKYKKKPPKPRRPRPGQVHIAVALDGTTLFCCPECNMAYPDKEMLEQHLVAHKIERRFICDICGAGLKRKEHLERHKLGHNPERPFICAVCCKGFKRKEHLNLHSVIHSGEKSEVCPECGKGFHRKDHLRKHARSHLAKRVKEETVVVHTGMETDGTMTEDGQVLVETQESSLILHNSHSTGVQTAGVQTMAQSVVQQVQQQSVQQQVQHHVQQQQVQHVQVQVQQQQTQQQQ
ncbi:ZnF_C2H2 [Nesidiocoris tenuis]|uniref:ZnF_C2H2 n=1 Tax=Nesidiocoris tenuis TaxID=355587 RepID=A0ABN7BB99_9HEMI|nr:ZnF_C2H2 [Nesidiocoris tenuis]